MYLALYRKYRPKTFDDVVSQEHIIKTLKNQIIQGKTAHAYLFTGSRGTGKTTCAKIFAKAVNCPNAVNGEPCLECEVCRGIDDGSVTDVVEIDAASNNGVENIRELRETAFFTPTFAKYRVYIIDEVHMLSMPAFNALLKIMEEPPAHVKFILATTEVHKVPITVISRCQRFDFKRIKDEDIAERLKVIAAKEKVRLDDDAASLIGRLADGALRDGISLLDRILASTDEVTLEAVENSVGIAATEYLFELADCIADYDSTTAISVINELYMDSKDLQRLCSELINHFRNLMLIKAMGDCGGLIKATAEELERMTVQQQKFSMNRIIYILTKLQESLDKIGKTSGKRIEFEMCMIRLCTEKQPKQQTTSIETAQPEETKAVPFEIPKLRRDTQTPYIKPDEKEKIEPLRVTETKPEEKTEKIENEDDVSANEVPIPETLIHDKTDNDEPADDIPASEMPLHDIQEANRKIDEETEKAIEHKEEAKSETKDEKSSAKWAPIEKWSEIMDELVMRAPHLAAMKESSKGYIRGESLYIGVSSPLLNAQLKRDGNVLYLREAIYSVLGRDYKIKLKSNSTKKTESKTPMDILLADAKALGINIEE